MTSTAETYRHPVHIEAIGNAAKNLTKVATLVVHADSGITGVYCETCSYDEEYPDECGEPRPYVRWDRHFIPLDAQFTGICLASNPPANYRVVIGPACLPRRCLICQTWTRRPKYCSSGCATRAKRRVAQPHPCLGCRAPTTRPKYCSTACKERRRYPLSGLTDHVCIECGSGFSASPLARYCGKRCSKRAEHRRHRQRRHPGGGSLKGPSM